jgi:hypothetical protein
MECTREAAGYLLISLAASLRGLSLSVEKPVSRDIFGWYSIRKLRKRSWPVPFISQKWERLWGDFGAPSCEGGLNFFCESASSGETGGKKEKVPFGWNPER